MQHVRSEITEPSGPLQGGRGKSRFCKSRTCWGNNERKPLRPIRTKANHLLERTRLSWRSAGAAGDGPPLPLEDGALASSPWARRAPAPRAPGLWPSASAAEPAAEPAAITGRSASDLLSSFVNQQNSLNALPSKAQTSLIFSSSRSMPAALDQAAPSSCAPVKGVAQN